MWLSWANEGPFLSRTHKLLIVLIYWKIGRKRGKVRQLHKTLYHHLSLPSIKKTLVAVATVKPHSGSSSSKIQNLSKTLTYNTVLSHPEDRFLALLCCLKRKRLSKELMNPSQGFCCKVRFCRDNYLKSLKFLPPPPPPNPAFFFFFSLFLFPPSFSALWRRLLHAAYFITTSSSIKQNAYTSVRCHSLSHSFPHGKGTRNGDNIT